MKPKLLISFSGGRTSAYMTHYLLNNKKEEYEMIVVFANTGKERTETLDFVNQCDKMLGFKTVWLEAKTFHEKGVGTGFNVVTYNTADRTGKVFEEHIKKYGIPNKNAPQCTRELKRTPIEKYARSLGWTKYITAIGIRSDEPNRISWEAKRQRNLLYFAELFHVTKSDVNKFWNNQPFDLNLKSYEGNCDLCYKKSLRKLMTIVKYNPELAKWWADIEMTYEYNDPRDTGLTPFRFYKDNLSILDIIEESKYDFNEAIDESKIIDKYKQLSLFDSYLDSNLGCTESCEVY